MSFGAAAALLSAALAGVDGTAVDVQASGRTESSALAFAPDGGATRTLAALDVLPRVALAVDARTLRLTLAYEPQLRLSQALSYGSGDATLVHGGSARAEWAVGPLWRVTGAARTAVRVLDFVAPGGGDLARLLDLRRAPPVFRYGEDSASAAVEGRPTRLVTVGASVGVESSGGVGADSRAAVPGLREVRAGASVARAWTDVDVLRLELAAAAASFDVGGGASVATLTAGWARQATRTLRLRLAASASAASRDAAGRVLPGGEAGLEASPLLGGRPLALAVALRAGPAFDRFAAGVLERAGVDATAMWAVAPRWRVGAVGAFARVLEAGGYAAGRGDLRAEWKASRRWTLYGDVWNERHGDPAAAAGTASYFGASAGLLLAPQPR